MNSTTHSIGENFFTAVLLRTFVWSIGEVDWKGTMKEKQTVQDWRGTMKEVFEFFEECRLMKENETNSTNVGTSATKADIVQTFCCKAFISMAEIVVFISLQDWRGTKMEVYEKCRVMKLNQTKPIDAWDQFGYKTETVLGYMILLIFIFSH